FDGPPQVEPGPSHTWATGYVESNMQFTGQDSRFLGPYFAFPYTGTAYLQTFPSLRVAFEFLDGSLFDMHSVDLAELASHYPSATVPFVGYRPDGSSVATEFITAGIRDDDGRPAFHTFHFGPEFTGLNRIEIPSGENGYS